MRLKRETQGAFCVLNANTKSQTRKSMKINVICTVHAWIVADEFPPWAEVKSMLTELRSLWHHRNNLSVDDNGTLWRKRSSQSALVQLLVPKAGREQLFLSHHASLYGGHLGRTQTLARLADRFY